MMKKFVFFVALLGLAIACSNDPFAGFKETESGLRYKIIESGGDTLKAREGDIMSVRLNYITLEEESLDSMFNNPNVVSLPLRKSVYTGDIYEGLSLLTKGDSARFVTSVDSFFTFLAVGEPLPKTVDSGAYFFIDVRVEDIMTKEQANNKRQKEMAEMQAKKDSLNQLYMAQEQAAIQNYIQQNNIRVEPDTNGMYVMMEKVGTGKSLAIGNGPNRLVKYAKVHVQITNAISGENKENTIKTNPEGVELLVGGNHYGRGFDLILQQQKVGAKFVVLAPSSMAFGERGIPNFLAPFTPLIYSCEVLDVLNEEEFAQITKKRNEIRLKKQYAEMAQYAKSNGYTTKPDKDHIYKKVLKEGKGEAVGNGKLAMVHYTGTFLNGEKFDSSLDRNKPLEVVIGQGGVIPGWDKVLSQMKVGEKVEIILPSAMAYGSTGNQGIPPFTPLVFEMELLSVNK